MTRDDGQLEQPRVKLLAERGATSRFADAAVERDGTLVVSGQDVGRTPREQWGDGGYEFAVFVPGEHKDRLLLALIEHVFGGHFSAADESGAFRGSHEIPFEFWNRV